MNPEDVKLLLLLIPLAPLMGALTNALAGKDMNSKRLSGTIACASVGLAFVMAVIVVWSLASVPADQRFIEFVPWTWMAIGGLEISMGFALDPLSSVMILVITGVGFLIHVYSTGYMAEEEYYSRYFVYLNLFTASMLVLVLGSNFLVMFVGWEMVGLCSYLLIGYYFHKDSAADAGKKAFIVNRVGDFGFLIGLFIVLGVFGTLDFSDIVAALHHDSLRQPLWGGDPGHVMELLKAKTAFFGVPLVTIATLSMFVGATGKSAQIPLYVWLPDAMEGPTPVSALIHAATMVTAGVYMIARMSALFVLSPVTLEIVAVIGAATALFAATIGFAQTDIKRVLAYSTVSQLGFMFLAAGVGAFTAAVFHLMTHAFFKALMFLGSGSVIHGMHHEQDMRKMGNLKKYMPITYWTFVCGWVAICGVPFTSGFFSKDELLHHAFLEFRPVYIVGLIAAMGTAFYMTRLMGMTFWGKEKFDTHGHGDHGHGHDNHGHGHAPHESPKSILAVASLFGGLLGLPAALSHTHVLSNWLAPVFETAHHLSGAHHADHSAAAIALEWKLMGIATVGALTFMGIGWFLYKGPDYPIPDQLRTGPTAPLHKLLLNKYYVDEIYTFLFVYPGHALAWLLWKFDQYVVDGVVNGVAKVAGAAGLVVNRLNTGFLRNYALAIVVGAILLLAWLVGSL